MTKCAFGVLVICAGALSGAAEESWNPVYTGTSVVVRMCSERTPDGTRFLAPYDVRKF